MTMSATCHYSFRACNIRKTKTTNIAGHFGSWGYAIKKTMMMSTMFINVVSQLVIQKEIQDVKHNSSPCFLEATQ